MKRLLATAAFVTVAVLGFTATPAYAATITAGHIDALDVDYSGGVVSLDIRTYNPPNANDDDVPAAGTTIRLAPLADYDLAVPGSPSSWACVGAASSTVYVAPASVGSGDPRIWPGWNTDDVPAANRPVTIRLVSVSGPGHVTLYTLGGLPAQPSVVLSNNSATGCPKSTFGIAGSASHGHANWAFSAPGSYHLTFRATVTGGPSSADVTYHFQIG
jgi:surface-anchored protein